IVLHTNLGRAPLAAPAVEAVVLAAREAVNLELDIATGRRGSRDALVEDDLRALTGAQARLGGHTTAAAVLPAIAALAAGRGGGGVGGGWWYGAASWSRSAAASACPR